MKEHAYRDPGTARRLKEGVKEWKARGGKLDPRPKGAWREANITWIFAFIPLLGVFGLREVFMGVLLPLTAAMVFGRLGGEIRETMSHPMSSLLPISQEKLNLRVRQQFRKSVIFGIFYALLCGSIEVGGPFPNTLVAIRAMVIYLGILGLFFCLPSDWMGRLQTLIIYACGGSILFLFIIEPAREPLQAALKYLPWVTTLRDGSYLWCFGILAITGAWLLRKRGLYQVPVNREIAYEFTEWPEHFEEEEEGAIHRRKLPSAPKGRMEEFIWNRLSGHRQQVARAAGLNEETFISTLRRSFFYAVGFILLARVLWSIDIGWIQIAAIMVGTVGVGSSFLSITGCGCTSYRLPKFHSPTGGIPLVALLPISITSLEAMWRREITLKLPVWTTASCVIPLLVIGDLDWGFVKCLRFIATSWLVLVLTCFFTCRLVTHCQILIHFTTKRGRGWGRRFAFTALCFASFRVLIAFLITNFNWALSIRFDSELPELFFIFSGSLCAFSVIALIQGALVRSLVKDPRCDMIGE